MKHGRFAGCLLLALAALLLAGPAPAQEGLDVVKMVVSGAEIEPGAEQLVQITLHNGSGRAVAAGLRLELRNAGDRRLGRPLTRTVTLPAHNDKRVFFRLRAPEAPGRYAIKFEVYTPDFRHKLLPGAPVFYAPFRVGAGRAPLMAHMEAPAPAAKESQARIALPRYTPPRGLTFEKADLVWENFDVTPSSLLVGEPLHIRADLRNVGGDVTVPTEVSVDYYNTAQPGQLHNIATTTVEPLAPGEKIELEYEKVLPEDALLGEYKIVLTADVGDKVEESDETNNRVVSATSIRLSRIKLIFPPANYTFEEAGLFLFRWDSLRYDEFKVQVSTDSKFNDPANQFDIPQGDKWSKDKEVVPLEGELPDMARGLMEKSHTHTIYWRVEGRNSKSGETRFSEALPFSITLQPGKRKAAPMKPAAPEVQGAPQVPPPPQAPAPSQAQPPADQSAAPAGAPAAGGTAPAAQKAAK